jgi:hypothetical protein
MVKRRGRRGRRGRKKKDKTKVNITTHVLREAWYI